MNIYDMAAALAATDAAMILEGVDSVRRNRVLDRLGKTLAITAVFSQPVRSFDRRPGAASINEPLGEKPF